MFGCSFKPLEKGVLAIGANCNGSLQLIGSEVLDVFLGLLDVSN